MNRSTVTAIQSPAAGQLPAADLIDEISDPLEIVANLVYLARSSETVQEDRETFLTIACQNIAAVSAIIERYATETRTLPEVA
ncbi:MAG TPA: hypothetical protein VHZ09_16510 [Acidobacteriaceae bacterium]|jgi:hypothetical protein|nr:hypothetical protein [Acidobacteriaceae bacterium]